MGVGVQHGIAGLCGFLAAVNVIVDDGWIEGSQSHRKDYDGVELATVTGT
jgi:hypothetical protein